MSRGGPSGARNLTLTEELEKLEQTITLTLQEIDSNFSRAHRIVTTSILPLIEQYGEHSRAVWEASKFWKQFFEASANVSLSGYEELAVDEDTTAADETTVQDETSMEYTPHVQQDDAAVATDQEASYQRHADDSLLDDEDGELTGSTPRVPATKSLKAQFANLSSPYEDLKNELKGHPPASDEESESEVLLQQHTARLPDMSMTPRASLDPASDDGDDIFSAARKNKDPILHRLADKTYRIEATPHKPLGVSPIKWKVTGKAVDKDESKAKLPAWEDESPMSSPEMKIPTLRSAAFMSPVKAAYRNKLAAASSAPRTPGISVQTPATGRKTKDVFAGQNEEKTDRQKDEIMWESDEDESLLGMSPPKTVQFALPPSKLMQTPAREASKRIVDDILLNAGVEPEESSEYSPTVVKMNSNILDDTF